MLPSTCMQYVIAWLRAAFERSGDHIPPSAPGCAPAHIEVVLSVAIRMFMRIVMHTKYPHISRRPPYAALDICASQDGLHMRICMHSNGSVSSAHAVPARHSSCHLVSCSQRAGIDAVHQEISSIFNHGSPRLALPIHCFCCTLARLCYYEWNFRAE